MAAIENNPELIYLQPSRIDQIRRFPWSPASGSPLCSVPLSQRYDRGFRDAVKAKIMGNVIIAARSYCRGFIGATKFEEN